MSRVCLCPTLAEIDVAASDWVIRRNFGLTAGERVELARWQAADPRHAEAFTRHAEAWAMLDRPRSAGKGDLIVRELGARAIKRRRRRVGATAGAVGLLCVIGLTWQGWRPLSQTRDASTASATVLLPEKRSLPDGSVVELKTGAQIEVDFSGVLRRVALRSGEAHFEVAKNPERPFVVTAGGVEVRAVGTAFAVQLGKTIVEVLVTEGRVAVERPVHARGAGPAIAAASDAPRDITTLNAGSRVVVELASQSATPQTNSLTSAQLAHRLAWRAPRLEFSETPLAEAVALMNRYSTVRIEIADPALARMRVNGLFRADNTDPFIRLLEASFDAKAERSGDTIVLKLLATPAR
jgi:transmembrane sensor